MRFFFLTSVAAITTFAAMLVKCTPLQTYNRAVDVVPNIASVNPICRGVDQVTQCIIQILADGEKPATDSFNWINKHRC